MIKSICTDLVTQISMKSFFVTYLFNDLNELEILYLTSSILTYFLLFDFLTLKYLGY